MTNRYTVGLATYNDELGEDRETYGVIDTYEHAVAPFGKDSWGIASADAVAAELNFDDSGYSRWVWDKIVWSENADEEGAAVNNTPPAMMHLKQPVPDMVNHPPHYTSNGIEVIDVIEAFSLGNARIANVIKYVLRHEHKNGTEDLKKALWYLQREVNAREEADG